MADTVYSLEQIETLQGQLQAFAKTPRTRFSKREAVEALIDDIEVALERHPYDEVAEKLKDWGLDITAGSLKQYVNAYRREQQGADKPTSSSRKRAGKKKKKAASKKAANGRSEMATQKATNGSSENGTSGAADSRSDKRTNHTSNRTLDGFLEMAEDL